MEYPVYLILSLSNFLERDGFKKDVSAIEIVQKISKIYKILPTDQR